jgi:DASS family divalent anion:Na+ symporter
MFSIFIATILGIILKPFPMSVVALIGLLAAILTKTLDGDAQAFSGFASPVIWLIVYVFFIARGFIQTRLGNRIAYHFVKLLGGHSLGLGYGMVLTELFIAPVIPSNAARAGGIMYPIMQSIATSLGSEPTSEESARKLGGYLAQVCCHGNLITSAMFLTAMAANPMAQSLASAYGIDITWMNWFQAAIVPGLLSLFILPLFLYIVYPPRLKKLTFAKKMAEEKLQDMGPMSRNEWTMSAIFILMLVLWIWGGAYGINSATTGLIGLLLLIFSKILSWNDILDEKQAWDTLIWFAILVSMAKFLQTFGFVDWFSGNIGALFKGIAWPKAFLGLILVYFYSHYFFASNTAHVGAMYAAFLGVAVFCGVPSLLAALVLGFCSSLFSSMTHYGSSACVVLYGSGYVPITTWWGLGLLVSVMNLLIWGISGAFWWKTLGLW